MPGSLKNKLSQFEAVPPAGAWEKIATRLNEEMAADDGPLALKLDNAVVEPPADIWGRIEAELDETVSAPVRVVPIYRRIAVAAAVIGVLVVSGMYFLRDNEPAQKKIVSETSIYPASNEITREEDVASSDTPSGRTAGLSAMESPQTHRPVPRRVLAGTRNNSSVHQLAQLANYTDIDINDPKPVQMVSAMEPVQVDAPPIRDARGNVIMDLSVISNPNEPYITVTSPGGSQTKISKKFLNCLSYLNGNYTNSEINYEGQQWKSRFAEWRNKISEAGFVPGASNFFDIFELQELIRD